MSNLHPLQVMIIVVLIVIVVTIALEIYKEVSKWHD